MTGGRTEFYLGELKYHYEYDESVGNNLAINGEITGATFTPAPEPMAIVLFGTMLLGFAICRKARA